MSFKICLEKQIQKNSNLNLLYKDLHKINCFDDDFKTSLLIAKQNISLTDEIIDFTVKKLLKSIYKINQYLIINQSDIRKLIELYKRTWTNLDSFYVENVLNDHFFRLSKWIEKIYPPKFINILNDQPYIGQVINEQYNPLFQLSILGLNEEELVEPILDIGCGENAYLVEHLRKKGFRAYGIDRIINNQNDYLIEKDWFYFSLENQNWGTVISHLAFSNHINHSFTHNYNQLDEFLKIFVKILDSLKPNGIFAYAPSVKQIESILDTKKFDISYHKIQKNYFSTKVRKK